MGFKKRLLVLAVPVVILLVGVAIFVVLVKSKPKPATKTVVENVWQVSAERAVLGRHAPTLPLYGRVQSPSQVVLTAAIEADVAKVLVSEGERVTVGQLLAELDSREAAQRLKQREGELAEMTGQLAAEKERYKNDQVAYRLEEALLALSEKRVVRLGALEKRELGAQSQLDEANEAKTRQQLVLQSRRYALDDHAARLGQLEGRLTQAQARRTLATL
ncbi:MAG: RND family efflux transporter MFP subunit, partial [Halothiobacillaceae bacterium]